MNIFPLIIAEVKTESPFGYKSQDSWETLFEIADSIGDIISIHTDPRWGGSMELISRAKKLTDKPILAKGIHEKDFEIIEAIKRGTDNVLVVGRLPEIHRDKCLIEPNTLEELEKFGAVLGENGKFVWNSRNLETGGLKNETFQEARNIFPGWLCQASNIKSISDIIPGADAILVGTHLKKFAQTVK